MYVLIDSDSNEFTFYPEYDFEDVTVPLRIEHRTKGGRLYTYQYGEQPEYKFSLEFVSSADMSLVNSWWIASRELTFVNTVDGFPAVPVKIVNKTKPLGKRQKPYDNLFRGKIELSTF